MLVVLAQLAGFAHEAAVRHVRCADHGELVEATDAGATSVYSSAGVRGVEHGATCVDHEHCAIASALHNPTSTTHTATLALAHVDVLVDARTRAPSPAASTTDRYRLAPKTSPPDLES